MGTVNVAVVGVGNNISALLQGLQYYRSLPEERGMPGVSRPKVGSFTLDDIRLVAAFDVSSRKVGLDLADAVLAEPNNYPRIVGGIPATGVVVHPGAVLDAAPPHLAEAFAVAGTQEGSAEQIVEELRRTGTEVVLYSLPTGSADAARFYAECALEAGAALVNCTPEKIARDPDLAARFAERGLPIVGDDLASHLGSSIVHRTVLRLVEERGLTLSRSYQVNLGGNTDFKNLLVRGEAKADSKRNALGSLAGDRVNVVPSGGYLPVLGDSKVAHMAVEAVGWGGTPVTLEMKLTVQDSSNAAGVIVDLVRFAGAALRAGVRGPVPGAGSLLKSPGGGDEDRSAAAFDRAVARFEAMSHQTVADSATAGGLG